MYVCVCQIMRLIEDKCAMKKSHKINFGKKFVK